MAVYDFMQRLIFSRQLKFDKGSIQLLGRRVVISNSNLFAEYIQKVNNAPDLTFLLYDSVRNSFRDDFAQVVGEKFKFKLTDFVRWMTDLAMFSGWGKFSWTNLSQQNYSGIIIVEDSPIVNSLITKFDQPVDHVIRGFIGGGASAAFQKDIHVIELKCSVIGIKKCEFIFGEIPFLKSNYSSLAYQIGAKSEKN